MIWIPCVGGFGFDGGAVAFRLRHGCGLAVVAGDAIGDEPVGGAAFHVKPFARLERHARVGVWADQNE